MREIDIGCEPTDLGNARKRERKVTAPCKINPRILELRKGFEHVGTNFGFDANRIEATVHRAAAEEYPPISRATEIIEDIVRILDTVVFGDQFAR